MANFVIPGDSGFPLNAMYSKPSSKAEAGNMSQTFVTSQFFIEILVCFS